MWVLPGWDAAVCQDVCAGIARRTGGMEQTYYKPRGIWRKRAPGHNPPLLLRAGGTLERLEPTGPAIGLVEDAQYGAARVTLAPGDRLVLYTDGITEAFNARGEMFEQSRLEAALRRNAMLPAQALVHALRDAVLDFTDGRALADDVTIVASEVTG